MRITSKDIFPTQNITLQMSLSKTFGYEKILKKKMSQWASRFLTLQCHFYPSLPSRSHCETFHCHRSLREKTEPLGPFKSLLELLRDQAGGEDGSHRRHSGKPRFPKQAPGCARKSSQKRRSCHDTGDAPQASSSPGDKGAQGRRLPP